MLKIRLMRIGAKKRPFYRVVAVDERAKRTGAYIELLGTYNPLTEPKDIKLKQDRIDYWIKQGAQLSTGYLRIIGKAPQRPPRKPKKERKQATGDSGQVKPEEVKPKEKPEEETAKSSEPDSSVILGSEATPESKEDAGQARLPDGQASMTENKPEESGKQDERPA